MSKPHRKKPRHRSKRLKQRAAQQSAAPVSSAIAGLAALYQKAQALAERGEYAKARPLYQEAGRRAKDPVVKARFDNDLAVLAAVEGDLAAARQGFEAALALDPKHELARRNLALLQPLVVPKPLETAKPILPFPPIPPPASTFARVKVALLSFLFNWPSSGGGNIHTVELAQFLRRAGYDVRHYYACFPPWQIGQMERSPEGSEPLEFSETDWNIAGIQDRYRRAVDRFDPDVVLITDCWNFKPHLAAALRGYPTMLRFQALECLCPLNNIRLLASGDGQWQQCPMHQLATPGKCRECLQQRGQFSGSLHHAERELSQVGTDAYHELLLRSLQEAEAVLVLNPMTQAMLSPYARRVEVVTWGMDPARFPWPAPDEARDKSVKTIFQAGVINEAMKGFSILHAVCAKLWEKRQDFRLVATGLPAGSVDAFTQFTGWVSQEELPQFYWAADLVAVPTVAQEGLSRTSVEAMASGRAVIASRIGGLPFSVDDGATGLLCEPGDVEDWCQKLDFLLTEDRRREEMGLAGRKRFEERFAWDKVIERSYRPLLHKKQTISASR